MAQARPQWVDDLAPEIREELGMAGLLGDNGGEDGQPVAGDHGVVRVPQDRQDLSSWILCLRGEWLGLHGIDAGHRELELVAVSSPQARCAGARGGRDALDGHPGVAAFAQVALGGGQDGRIQGYVHGASGRPGRGVIRCHVPPPCVRVVA